jgi:hypothetical protein
MLLRPATRNCGRNIGLLFKIADAKFQNAKFRTLPHSGSGNRPLPLLRVQLRPLPPLFITLVLTDYVLYIVQCAKQPIGTLLSSLVSTSESVTP